MKIKNRKHSYKKKKITLVQVTTNFFDRVVAAVVKSEEKPETWSLGNMQSIPRVPLDQATGIHH